MERIEGFVIQMIAVGTVVMALGAGLSLVQSASQSQPQIVKLERVIVTAPATVAKL